MHTQKAKKKENIHGFSFILPQSCIFCKLNLIFMTFSAEKKRDDPITTKIED